MKKLIFTNGESAASLISSVVEHADIISWDDVLHDGPVLKTKTLEELSTIRSDFISSLGWESRKNAQKRFLKRDEVFSSLNNYDEVILWFEHDLYDQLQLVQILYYLSKKECLLNNIFVIQESDYIGHQSKEILANSYTNKKKLTDEHVKSATNAWKTFVSDDPEQLNKLIGVSIPSHPYLIQSLVRLCEEFPHANSGLSRTEWQILNLVTKGFITPKTLFLENMKCEEAIYLGDWSFFLYLNNLSSGEYALLKMNKVNFERFDEERKSYMNQTVVLTELGQRVFNEDINWFKLAQHEKWIGGIKLSPENLWFWNPEKKKLIKNN